LKEQSTQGRVRREGKAAMKLRDKFKIEPGSKVKLSRWDASDTAGIEAKKQALPELEDHRKKLYELQYLLHAEKRRAVLIVLQAMDAGGKDGTIRHVMSGLNPQGCHVSSFKVPTEEELAHDYLWRIHRAVPGKGEIGIFNRSHYGDVLVVRVHNLVPKQAWSKRYEQINAFEKILAENGVTILKFFLHISKDEQKKRLQERLDDPSKHWKVSSADFEERKFWDDYTKAYEDALSRCSTPWAPWYIIPANRKWFRNLAVADILVSTLEDMDMQFPKSKLDLSKFVLD
jgi:PPK2 family polyphosphate:nucleotide phosphotransferase